jgi:hypothetical protein
MLLCRLSGKYQAERTDLNFEACEIVENNFNPFHFKLFTPFEKGGRGDLKISKICTILNPPQSPFFKGGS